MSFKKAIVAFKNEITSKKKSESRMTMNELLSELRNITSSGVSVTESTAMTIPAVLSCVRLLAETIASIPLIVYRREKNGGKTRATDHILYKILHDQPNPFMTSFTYRETGMAHLLLWGNSYCEIERDGHGDIKNLWPLNPAVTFSEFTKTGSLIYKTVINNKGFILPAENVLHTPGLSFDGLTGKSVIKWASESLGLAKAIEKYGNSFFGKGANPSGILKTEKKLEKTDRDRIRVSWNEAHEGLDRAFRVAVLDQALSWQQIGVNPEDAQALETRKYSRSEIASIFRVPPHMIGDLERATFSNVEQQSIEFVMYSIRPWATRFEQTNNSKLFFEDEKNKYFTEFLIDGLLRGDSKSRADALHIMRQDGIINADEWRSLENMNPIENGNGKKYLINGNMVDTAATKKIDERMFVPIFHDVINRIRSREDRDIERLSKKKEYQSNFRSIAEVLDDEVYSEPWIENFLEPVGLSITIACERSINIAEIKEKIIVMTKDAVRKSDNYDHFKTIFFDIRKYKQFDSLGGIHE